MPADNDFRFSLLDSAGLFWQVDSFNAIVKNSTPYYLQFSPSGWDDLSISNIRNKKYWGIDRSVTIPLAYVNDGAHILKHIFYTLGIEESVYLKIENQLLDYSIPIGLIAITSGSNPFTANTTTTGTITAPPGTVLYVNVSGTGFTMGDHVDGTINGVAVTTVGSSGSRTFAVTIDGTGIANFSLFFTSAGSSTARIDVSNAGGVVWGYGYRYKQIYRGEIDLSTFSHAGAKVTCATLEDGLPKFLKANEGTVFEFPLDVAEAVTVKMDGVDFVDRLNYQQTDAVDISLAVDGNRFYCPSSFISSEGDSVDVLTNSEVLEAISGTATWDDILSSDNFLLQNVGDHSIVLTVSGHLEFRCTSMTSSPAYAIRFRFLRSEQLLANQNDYLIYSSPGLVVSTVYSVDYSLPITLNPGEKLFLQGAYVGGVGSDAIVQFTPDSKFNISLVTKSHITFIKAFRPQYLFDQLISKVTDNNFIAALSSYFTTHSNKVFTSGNGIRNLTDTLNVYSATIKIAFTDFFKFWDSFDSVGIIEGLNTVGFDSKQNLVDLSEVIELGEVGADSLKITVAKDFLFNEYQTGYPPMKNDVGVLNGNEEFNTKFIFSLGITKAPAVLDKVSTIKASCYEIEKIRITTLDKTTTDYKADNELFVLHIEDTLQTPGGAIPDHYLLDRSLNTGATGLIEPATVFNLGLSPKRNLERNGGYIRSCQYLSDAKILKFISADKNSKLACGATLISSDVVEKDDVTIGTLNDPFFLPIYFDFVIGAPDQLLSLLDLNPLQIFSFLFHASTYFGILVKVSVAPSNRKEQGYQLLSISQDLSELIKNYGGI